mgnify:CR=1 FL=1
MRPAAAALDGRRGGRIIAKALTGEGSAAMRYANNALVAGTQTGLAGGDAKDAAALALGLGAAGKLGGKVLSPVTDRLSAGMRRAGDYLDPEGVTTRGSSASAPEAQAAAASAGASPIITAAQHAVAKSHIKAVAKVV